MRHVVAGGLVLLLILSAIPVPAAGATGHEDPNTEVVTLALQRALEDATDDLQVIVFMDREFTQADADWFENRDATYHGRLHAIPAALVSLDAESVVDLSWRSGVRQLDLNREIRVNLETANRATLTPAVWGDETDRGVVDADPLTDAAGRVIDGRGVSVAVVDSGIDATHPDLAYGSKVLSNLKGICSTPLLINTNDEQCAGNSFSPLLEDTAGSIRDFWVEMHNTDTSSGHGTHVAGIVAGDGTASAGKYAGAAPGASLVGFGIGEVDRIFYVLEAWDYVYQYHDDPELVGDHPIRVVTNSFGDDAAEPPNVATKNDPAYVLIEKMVRELGITFVFAAGNSGGDGAVDRTSTYCDYSGWIPGVLCVANGDDHNEARRDTMTLSSSSSRGRSDMQHTWPDLTAPGTSITSTWALNGPLGPLGLGSDYNPYYTRMSGTSMAAPHVAGIVSLLYQANPALTPADIEDALEDTALEIATGQPYASDPTNPDSDTSFDKGHGLVNASAAVQRVLATADAGSGVHGMTGGVFIYHSGLSPFANVRGFNSVAQQETVGLSVRSISTLAPWETGTLSDGAAGAFHLYDAAGDLVRTFPGTVVEGTNALGDPEFTLDGPNWHVTEAPGAYRLVGVAEGLVLDALPVRVLGADAEPPACVQDATLSYTATGPVLTGTADSLEPVDKVRVDALLDGDALAWGLDARTDATPLERFEIPLPATGVPAGADLRMTATAQDVPCVATLTVPGLTPESLASTQPDGLVDVGNPWMNPGFELTTGAEAASPLMPEGAKFRSVAPPTWMIVEDGQEMPHSTSRVDADRGTSGNALVVDYDARDRDRNLLIGQFLGAEQGPYQWIGGDAVSFDYRTSDDLLDFHVNLHYNDGNGNTWVTGSTSDLIEDGAWHRVTIPAAVPEDAVLTLATIRIRGDTDAEVRLDNVVVEGATYALTDLRNDLNDDYAVHVLPEAKLPNAPTSGIHRLSPWETGVGEMYAVQASVRDFRAVNPAWVDLTDVPGAFGVWGTEFLASGGDRGGLDVAPVAAWSATNESRVLFAMPKDTTLAQSDNGYAALWAFLDVEDAYDGTLSEFVDDLQYHPASGYFSALKNGLQDYTIADSLDDQFTPVELATDPIRNVSEPVTVTPQALANGDWQVKIQAPATGWVEHATLRVEGQPDRTVTLPGVAEDVLVDYGSADLTDALVILEPTLFTAGDTFNPLGPTPTLRVCAKEPGCDTDLTSVKTMTTVSFDARDTTNPQGGDLTFEWDFGDGQTHDGLNDEGALATHAYASPDTYTVTLTVTDAEGNVNDASFQLDVTNRAPRAHVQAPGEATRLDEVVVNVSASDEDGHVTHVDVTLPDGTVTTLQGDEGQITLDAGALGLGVHTVRAVAVDDHSEAGPEAVGHVQVVNLAPQVDLDADVDVIPVGGTVNFTTVAWDADDEGVTLTLELAENHLVAVENGTVVEHAFTEAGGHNVTLYADDGHDNATSVVHVLVDAEAPVTTHDHEAPESGWNRQNVTLRLTAEDNSGMDAPIRYSLDGGAYTPYDTAVVVGGDGEHVLRYYAEDAFGNREDPQVLVVRIDRAAPTVNPTQMPEDGSAVAGTVRLAATASDDMSGMASLRLLVDGEVRAQGAEAVGYNWETRYEDPGYHTLTLEATDAAGHTTVHTTRVLVMPPHFQYVLPLVPT